MHHKKEQMKQTGRANGFGSGISRVMQTSKDCCQYIQHGKMSATKGTSESHWKRDSSVPKRG
jgi:hypothetical protein